MSGDQHATPSFWSLPPMRYQNAYVWLVFVSVLDVYLTLLVLYVWEGHEVNPLAAAIIQHMGFRWTVAFKLALIVLVIVLCEVIGRADNRSGRTLAYAAVVIGSVPVAYTFALLFRQVPPAEKEIESTLSGVALLLSWRS